MFDPTVADIDKALALGLIDYGYCASLGLPVADHASALAWLRDGAGRATALAPGFDPGVYLERYPDIAAAPIHPLIHYLRNGMAEGRNGFPVFAAARAGLAGLQRPIWIESHDLGLTGAPLALRHILQGWPDLARAAILGAPCDGPLGAVFAQMGAHVLPHAQSARRAVSAEGFEALVMRAVTLLRDSGARFVLGNSALAWPMICAAGVLGLPRAWIIHEPDPVEIAALYAPDPWARITAQLPLVDRLIFVSRASRAAWGAGKMAHAQVIEKALPPQPGARSLGRQIAGAAPGDIVLLSVGTISPRKGQADLAAALAHLADGPVAPHLVTVVVGYSPSPYAQDLRQRLADLRQRGMRVVLMAESRTLEARTRVEHLFAGADLFAMTSRAESLPLTTAEALAAGCPVISTDVPGIGEMIAHGTTGLHYTPGDTGLLAAHIQRLALDGDLRQAMRHAIAARPREGGFAAMIAGYRRALLPIVPSPAAAMIAGAAGKTSSR